MSTASIDAEDFAVVVTGSGPGCGRLTQAELYGKASQFARTLRAYGLAPGDSVAMLMGNRIEVPVIVLGARWAGVDLLPLSTHVRAEMLAPLLKTLQPKLLVASEECFELAEALWALSGDPSIIRMLAASETFTAKHWLPFDTMIGVCSAEELIEKGNGRLLLTSGGTTGEQKVVRPQQVTSSSTSMVATPEAAKAFGVSEHDVTLVTGPLYHTMGASSMAQALNAGAKLVVMSQHGKWNARLFMELIQAYRVTRTMMVPTMMARVNALLDRHGNGYDISSLVAIVHGAAPCAPSVKVAFMGYFPGLVFEAYGGTEGFATALASPSDWMANPGTVGRPLGHVVIRDEDGNEVPSGTPGIIWGVVPAGVEPMSYMGRDSETRACIVERGNRVEGTLWDIGYLNEDGFLFITGRRKDMMIVGGVNTYPIDIEKVLQAHPCVVDVAVVGVSHSILGEIPVAAVELAEGQGSDALAAELRAWCEDAGMGRHAVPQRIIFVEELPRTPSGKMPKTLVRQLVDAHTNRR